MVRLLLVAVLAAGPPWPDVEVRTEDVCVVARIPGEAGGVDDAFIRRIFSLRRRTWPDGTTAQPVNLPATAPLRERFTQAIFGQSVRDQADFWSERYFHGTRPPPTLGSQEAVLLFVSRTVGAVGYIDGERAEGLPDGVRVLLCTETR